MIPSIGIISPGETPIKSPPFKSDTFFTSTIPLDNNLAYWGFEFLIASDTSIEF